MKIKFAILFLLFGLLFGCSSVHKNLENLAIPKISGERPEERKYLVPRWSKNLDPAYDSGNLPIAVHAPLVHEGLVFVGSQDGNMLAFDAHNGRPIWKGLEATLIENGEGTSYYGKPEVYRDQLIYGTTGGRVYSRHILTGEIKYAVDLDAAVESPPVIHKGRLLFHLRNHKIFCLDVETGKILWAYKRSVSNSTTIQRVATPMIHNDKVIVGFADGNLVSIDLNEGVLLWERKLGTGTKFIDIDAAPIVVSGKILAGSLAGPLSLIDPKTGNLLQNFDITISKTPIYHQDKIYLGTVDGELVIMDKNFLIKKRSPLSQGGLTTMALWKEHLVVGSTAGEIFLLDKEGELIERKHMGHAYSAIFGDISTSEGIMAVLTSRNRLYVY